eukprot:816244-Rhodomonas_salina.1
MLARTGRLLLAWGRAGGGIRQPRSEIQLEAVAVVEHRPTRLRVTARCHEAPVTYSANSTCGPSPSLAGAAADGCQGAGCVGGV